MEPRRSAAVAGLVVVVLWASAFPAIQRAVPELGAIGLSFVRQAGATLVLLAIAPLVGTRRPERRDAGWILACGFFGMLAYPVLLNISELHVPAGTASIIVASAPLVSVAVARVLFSEPITSSTVVGSIVALAGVTVVCAARAGLSVSRSVWAVVAAMVVQGIFHPLQRPLLARYRGVEVATYSIVAGTVMTLPLVPLAWSSMTSASGSGWAGAIYLALVPSALGFALWGHASAHVSTAAVTSLLFLVPPVAVLIAWAWFGEVPTWAELGGGVLVLAGVVIVKRGTARAGRLVPAAATAGRSAD